MKLEIKILVCFIFFSHINSSAQQILINELMSSNSFTITDEDGDYPDWIELYNPQPEAIDLTGYGISDEPSVPFKWVMPSVNIAAYGYLLIFADDKNRDLHTNFKLSSDGETLVITNPLETTIDQVDFGKIGPDISYGRQPDGSGQWFFFQEATPNGSNTTQGYSGTTTEPLVSPPGGFYSSSVTVNITAGSTNDKIYYTLDGSEPDETSPLYIVPILINPPNNTGKVLRVKAFSTGLIPSKTLTNTYFINLSSTLPVISLSTDPYNLFDYNYGIYADGPGWTPDDPHFGANYWMDWERPVHVELFETNGIDGFSIDAGIKIHGNWTRALAQKSLAIFARGQYGYSILNYKLFDDLPFTEYEAFILRNSGSDWSKTMFRDALMTGLVDDVDIDKQAYRPAIVFINGEYWGIYNIRERINEHFIAQHHNVDAENLDRLEKFAEVQQGDNLDYLALYSFIENNDIAIFANYEYVKTKMEVDEFIRYFVSEIYFDNTDWPENNIRYWRDRNNGKWRWILFDTDFGFGVWDPSRYTYNTLEWATYNVNGGWPPPYSTLVLRKLLENPSFKNDFINCFADYSNSIFSSSVVVNRINSMKSVIEPEIPRHGGKWGTFNLNSWLNNVKVLRDFANQRLTYVRQHYAQKFGLSGLADVNLSISDNTMGSIKLNSLDITTPTWSGTYFLDVPISISAQPKQGYHFVSWEGSNTSSETSLAITVAGTVNLNAIFEVDLNSVPKVVINEINYNSHSSFNPDDWVELYNNDDEAVDISGWVFKDDDDGHAFTIPEGTILEKGGYIVLCMNTTDFHTLFPDVSNYIGDVGFGLGGSGDMTRLYDDQMNIIDALTYDDVAPWPTEPDGNGPTLALRNPNLDNSLGENWAASQSHGTPGKINFIQVMTEIYVYLQGPYISGSMSTTLNQPDVMPLSPPYNAAPWNYAITENVTSIPSGVVDWVLVELRSGISPDTRAARRAALLKSEGSIVDLDGTSALTLSILTEGNYYIVVYHRNHCAVMSSSARSFSASTTTSYDFINGDGSQFYPGDGSGATELGTNIWGMITGDANSNGQVQNNDSENYWKPENGTSGYKNTDFNMNGEVQNNDNEEYWKPNNGRGSQVQYP